MSALLPLNPTRRDQVLNDAAERNLPAVLSAKEEGGWAVCKSRFVAADREQGRLCFEFPGPSALGRPALRITPGENIGVAFRRGHKKCIFTATVLARQPVALNAQTQVDALEVAWPDEVREVQRRAYYRVSVPGHQNVPVLLWAGGAARRGAVETHESMSYRGRLADISAGGMRLTLTHSKDFPIQLDEPVGVEFQPEPSAPGFLLDAALRHVTLNRDGSLAVGLRFAGLESTAEGRRVLQRLLRVINLFQRQELRRARLLKRTSPATAYLH